MKNFYENFLKYLEIEHREKALNYILEKLNNNEIDIVDLYTKILSPSLNEVNYWEDKSYHIWKEHVRSSIIRTIIENCYPYVIKERDNKYKLHHKKRIAIVCPRDEQHELGARMITDFFILAGYDSIFVGGNTPTKEFLNALNKIELDYIAISVSNYYNLVEAYKAIQAIKNINNDIKILVGGNAFKNKKKTYKDIDADMYLESFNDILSLGKEDANEISF
ncbi:cobalamin B12-binding domain-containing protein [Senegalia massiliensis]|uniref:cobalamin B12-binding domain-containing protein n=1 Tax=Senegalia massiliensis TaxID=1720316 RepID=UPI001030F37D|nr:cobalamin-dependent protein [Senegalia massiliensis]